MTRRIARASRSRRAASGTARRPVPSSVSGEPRLLQLGAALGNRRTTELLADGLQRRLAIGPANHPQEREADRMAARALSIPHGAETTASPSRPAPTTAPSAADGAVLRVCGPCAEGGRPCRECEEEERSPAEANLVRRQCAECGDDDEELRRQPEAGESSAAPPAVPLDSRMAALGPGRPLSEKLRGFFEPRFGHDFGAVRLHTNSAADAAARAARARAFTLRNDVVFAAGEYAPSLGRGRQLIAHELAHVVQQRPGARRAPVVQRQETRPAEARPEPRPSPRPEQPTRRRHPERDRAADAPAPRQRRRGTAASAPTLDVVPSANGEPCACLVFIHNDERNARLTARLMHRHCSYNLAIVAPDDRQRGIRVPRNGRLDPNELFPREVAEQCLADPQPCADYLTANAGSRDADVVRGYVQRQFFLAIRECSNAFTLPVVALHNNTIGDTARFRARVSAADTTGVRGETFGQTPTSTSGTDATGENPARPLQELRDWLSREFDEATVNRLTGRAGTTNIFRWCVSPDISRCHVGDPANPDRVTWVTNEDDFDRLSRAGNINVVLQTGAAASGESATDLSTLFLIVQELIRGRYAPAINSLEEGMAVNVDRIAEILRELEQMREYGDLTLGGALSRVFEILRSIGRLLLRLVQLGATLGLRELRLSQVRYLNIETPGTPTSAGQTPAQLRVASYGAIVAALRAAGLHCCGDDPAAAEQRIREGLRRGTLEETDPAER